MHHESYSYFCLHYLLTFHLIAFPMSLSETHPSMVIYVCQRDISFALAPIPHHSLG